MSYVQTDEILVEIDLFKSKQFDFITNTATGDHRKQKEALNLLTDDETVELVYGGAAGGAKSWTGCVWLLFFALIYDDTRWFIGREELKRLRESTLITFFKVCKEYGLRRDVDYKYNGQDHFLSFPNGSRIDLLDLKYLPSDPLYERYGSIEYTGGWIEEGGEVNFAAFDTLRSRVGRHNNDRHGLIRKILITCNPKKNWIYIEFYRKWKDKVLPKVRKFLQVFYTDNPHLESGYADALASIKDKVKRERLKDGNWEYDDDPSVLCDYDAICDLFTNDHIKGSGQKFISADLAMKGRDRFVAAPWDGLICDLTKGIDEEISSGKSIETGIKKLMVANAVGHSRTIADSDGLGAYLESYLNGIKEFHGNEKASDKEYQNLKSQCAFKLAELVNDRKMKIICSEEQKERIIEELGCLRQDDVDADEKKKRIIKKEDMKDLIQRSPDYLDMLIMRMYFEVKRPAYGLYYG